MSGQESGPAPVTRRPARRAGGVWWTLAGILAVVFAAELLVMLVLSRFPALPPVGEGLVDALALVAIGAPFIWRVVVAQAEHQRLEARTSALLGTSVDAIICCDGDGRVTLFNRGAERMFGYEAADIIGQPVHGLLPASRREAHVAHVGRFAAGPDASRTMGSQIRLEGQRRDGTVFPADISISRMSDGDDVLLTAVVRDVTDRVRAENELRQAKERAEEGARAKSEFLANMSHEIRTPMNAVIGLTGILLDTSLNADQREFTETIRSSGDALLAIINDILDYSKIEAGRLDLEDQPFDLRECVESALDLVSGPAAAKSLDLVFLVEESVPTTVVGDVTRLRQILVNLLSNAIKFTAQGEVFVTVDATAGVGDDLALAFTVRDTGIGIPADKQDRLFRSFSQVDASTTRHFGGTGLGLAISRRLAEMMGGRMTVESDEGRGSSFRFTAVMRRGHAEPTPVRAGVHESLRGRTVLIVDDNATNCDIVRRHVERWGGRAVLAASGEEALRVVAGGQRFDVGLLDYHMPGMDGVQLAERMRTTLGATVPPLVLLSSQVLRPHAGAATGFAGVLTKPIKPASLLRAVSDALTGEQSAAAAQAPLVLDRDIAVRHPLRVLLAEDNPVNQKVAVHILERMGYRADVVGTGVEALEAAEARGYDLILMDVQMPEMDGLDATRRIRALPDQAGIRVQIVAMTASAMDNDREAAIAAGMDAFVGKPVRVEELRDAVIHAAERLRRVS